MSLFSVHILWTSNLVNSTILGCAPFRVLHRHAVLRIDLATQMAWRRVDEPLVPAMDVAPGAARRRARRRAAVQRRLQGLEAAWAETEEDSAGFERWSTEQLRELLHRRGEPLEYAKRVERAELVEMVRGSTGSPAAATVTAAPPGGDGPRRVRRGARVRLGSIGCSGLDNSYCMAVVVLAKDEAGRWCELGCTEIVRGSVNPRFRASFDVSNCATAALRFEVMNVSLDPGLPPPTDLIGRTAELRLSDLVASEGQLSAELSRPGKAGCAGNLSARFDLLRGSWKDAIRSPVRSSRGSKRADRGDVQEQMWQNASADWRRRRDRDEWWGYHALMPRVWSSWSATADGWDAASIADMADSHAATFRHLHADALGISRVELASIARSILQVWRYHDTITMSKPRTQDDVVELLAKWVGSERIVWARVWKKYAKIYPDAFPLPRDDNAALDLANATAGGPENLDQTSAAPAAPRAESSSRGKREVSADTAKLRRAMVEQLLAEHRRHMATVPHKGGVDHVDQLAEKLELWGNELARTVRSKEFYNRYDQLHAAAHNLEEVSSSSTAARVGPTVIFLHRNGGSPLVLGHGTILRIDPSTVRPKAFDGIASGSKMDELLDQATRALKLQLYARRLFRPDGEF